MRCRRVYRYTPFNTLRLTLLPAFSHAHWRRRRLASDGGVCEGSNSGTLGAVGRQARCIIIRATIITTSTSPRAGITLTSTDKSGWLSRRLSRTGSRCKQQQQQQFFHRMTAWLGCATIQDHRRRHWLEEGRDERGHAPGAWFDLGRCQSSPPPQRVLTHSFRYSSSSLRFFCFTSFASARATPMRDRRRQCYCEILASFAMFCPGRVVTLLFVQVRLQVGPVTAEQRG